MQRQNNLSQGQDLVEYALLLPVLLLLLFSIVEISRVIFAYNTLSNAAHEGARRGVLAGATQADMCSAAQAYVVAAGMDMTCPGEIAPSLTVSVSQVIVTFPFELLVGPVIQAVGGDPVISLTATSEMRRE